MSGTRCSEYTPLMHSLLWTSQTIQNFYALLGVIELAARDFLWIQSSLVEQLGGISLCICIDCSRVCHSIVVPVSRNVLQRFCG